MASALPGNTSVQQIVFPPAQFSSGWVLKVTRTLLAASQEGAKATEQALPSTVAQQILEALHALLKHEPTVVDVAPATEEIPVFVVGDTHGQLHDVCFMLQKVGQPSEQQMFVFNGDFVDRGAWGLEVLILLACWKLAYPKEVMILRGNHECTTCTHMYGFRTEVLAKYGPKNFKDVFRTCKKVFAALPLAAVIGGQALVLHGGLFRKPTETIHKRKKRRKTLPGGAVEIGSLQDLRAAGKGGLDPNGTGRSIIATDVLWSDPAAQPGLVLNDARGVGLLFGPDVTQAFLEANKLKLIIRSHEGPDARWKREGMQDMNKGHSLDHDTPEGKLMTVFSAPDYPQFQPSSEDRFNNLGAVAVLRGSHDNFATPEMVEFPAAPRPEAQAYYEYEDVPDSDEEMSIGHGSPSDISAGSSQAGSDVDEAVSSNHGIHEEASSVPALDAVKQGLGMLSAQADISARAASPHAVNGSHVNTDLGLSHGQPGVSHTAERQSGASEPVDASSSRALEHTDHLASSAEQSAAEARNQVAETETASVNGKASNAKEDALQQEDNSQSVAVLPAEQKGAADYSLIAQGKAATAFDQDVANQAEAADVRAGIVADDGEKADPEMHAAQNNQKIASTIIGNLADKPSSDVQTVSTGQHANGSNVAAQNPRKVQSRPVPWR